MDSPVIEIRDLWFSFNSQIVLKEVNLNIYQKDFLGVIGPNGGGKTTLLKLMLGLLEADRGSILVFGRPPKQSAHRIGYVPQNIGFNKSFPILALDVVLMGRLKIGRGRSRLSKQDRSLAQKALEQVGMWEHRSCRIEELSGGQQQKVFIARSLVTKPEILFLDEPTSSVDTKGQTDLYALLRDFNETVTIVMASHDLMVLSSHIKSVACVNQNVEFHEAGEITREMIEMAYHCPVELIAHGFPHRVLRIHENH